MRSGAGPTLIKLPDDAMADSVDPREVDSTIDAMLGANRKLKIAVDRWRLSMAEDAKLEDRYIDLRIALEAIYLKDFINEHSQEMQNQLPHSRGCPKLMRGDRSYGGNSSRFSLFAEEFFDRLGLGDDN